MSDEENSTTTPLRRSENIQMLVVQDLASVARDQIEITNDEGFVDIVEGGFDAGVRMGESLDRDMVAVPRGSPVTAAVVASPEYLRRMPAINHPDDLARHNCIRSRFGGTGAIHKWEFNVDGKLTEHQVGGNLTVSDTLFNLDAAIEGVGLAYTFEQLAVPHIRAKKLKRVLTTFAPTFPGFYLYYPSRANQPLKMKALVDYARRWRR